MLIFRYYIPQLTFGKWQYNGIQIIIERLCHLFSSHTRERRVLGRLDGMSYG
jgi:hypothetical protein